MSQGIDRPVVADEQLRSRRIWYLFAVALLLLSLVLRQPLLIIAGLLVGALGVIPEIWYRYSLAGLVVQRRLSERRAMFGEEVTLTLVVENRKPLPLPWLEVQDEYPEGLPLRGVSLRHAAGPHRLILTNLLALWLYQRVTRRYMIRAIARGTYTFGPLALRSGDPFGLLTREQHVEKITSLIVYPLVVPVERFGLPARHPFGERTSPRRLLEDPLRVAGVRPYMYGDEPRRIHWKATARVGTAQSKVYEPATRHTLVLFVDMRTLNNSAYGYDPALFELAVCAAASVASWGLEQGYAVGLYSNGTLASPHEETASPTSGAQPARRTVGEWSRDPDARLDWIERGITAGAAALQLRVPPASHNAQLPRVLEGLARLYPYLGRPIERVVAAEEGDLPFGTSVVFVGAAVALDAGALAAFERLRSHGHSVTLLLTGDAPLKATTLPAQRIGGKEMWDALEAEALERGGAPTGLALG